METIAKSITVAETDIDQRFVPAADRAHICSLRHEEHFGGRNRTIDFGEQRLDFRDVGGALDDAKAAVSEAATTAVLNAMTASLRGCAVKLPLPCPGTPVPSAATVTNL